MWSVLYEQLKLNDFLSDDPFWNKLAVHCLVNSIEERNACGCLIPKFRYTNVHMLSHSHAERVINRFHSV